MQQLDLTCDLAAVISNFKILSKLYLRCERVLEVDIGRDIGSGAVGVHLAVVTLKFKILSGLYLRQDKVQV